MKTTCVGVWCRSDILTKKTPKLGSFSVHFLMFGMQNGAHVDNVSGATRRVSAFLAESITSLNVMEEGCRPLYHVENVSWRDVVVDLSLPLFGRKIACTRCTGRVFMTRRGTNSNKSCITVIIPESFLHPLEPNLPH
jgi:DNA-directed RNA polymerase subunit RPC12/RpoP